MKKDGAGAHYTGSRVVNSVISLDLGQSSAGTTRRASISACRVEIAAGTSRWRSFPRRSRPRRPRTIARADPEVPRVDQPSPPASISFSRELSRSSVSIARHRARSGVCIDYRVRLPAWQPSSDWIRLIALRGRIDAFAVSSSGFSLAFGQTQLSNGLRPVGFHIRQADPHWSHPSGSRRRQIARDARHEDAPVLVFAPGGRGGRPSGAASTRSAKRE